MRVWLALSTASPFFGLPICALPSAFAFAFGFFFSELAAAVSLPGPFLGVSELAAAVSTSMSSSVSVSRCMSKGAWLQKRLSQLSNIWLHALTNVRPEPLD